MLHVFKAIILRNLFSVNSGTCIIAFLIVRLLCLILAKIQSMKNAIPKNDKKRRKHLTEEIAKLEADLSQKHEEEFRQLKSTANTKVKACIQVIDK